MTAIHDIMPSNLVQIVHGAVKCPFKIYVQSGVVYEGTTKKYHARITVDDTELREYMTPILKSLGMFVFQSVSDPLVLRVSASDKLMTKILDKLPKPSYASKFEARLKKIFKEVTFSSDLTDATIEYVVAVRESNMIALLQVLETMGIDNWESVDKDRAVAFTLKRIPDIIW